MSFMRNTVVSLKQKIYIIIVQTIFRAHINLEVSWNILTLFVTL